MASKRGTSTRSESDQQIMINITKKQSNEVNVLIDAQLMTTMSVLFCVVRGVNIEDKLQSFKQKLHGNIL